MPLLPPNQQRQSAEGISTERISIMQQEQNKYVWRAPRANKSGKGTQLGRLASGQLVTM